LTYIPSNQAKDQTETLTKKGEEGPLFTMDESTTYAARKLSFTEISSPIHFITSLQFTRGNPNVEVIFIEDLAPISVEELPPSNFFFSEKRKAVVKREMHQKEGSVVKRHKVLIDGDTSEEVEFFEEVAGSLGDFATTNQFSVENLKE
jgi:hypothetical protein